MILKKYFKIIVINFVIFFIIGCSTNQHYLLANIQSTQYLNPNIYGTSAPLLITIYQLKSSEKFLQSNYFSLNKILADDVLDKMEVEIQPEDKKNIRVLLHPQTNYIGVVAGYRDPDQAQWRKIINIRGDKNSKVSIIASVKTIDINKP